MKKIEFIPELKNKKNDFLKFCKTLKLKIKKSEDKYALLSEVRFDLKKKNNRPLAELKDYEISLLLSQHLLLDLLQQDWILKVWGEKIWLEFVEETELTIQEAKEKIRRRHLLARDSQLQEKSVKDFVESMERRSLTKNGWHSIFSIMKNGEELSATLKKIRDNNSKEEKLNLLNETIKPYVQIVQNGEKCEFTGLKLMDIWRYFRHTWVNEYKSVPGRSINILIRDAGSKNHPVIGIAALGSSMVQFSVRDNWIGWDSKTFLKELIQNPSKKKINWIFKTYEDLVKDIYLKDLFKEKILTRKGMKSPSDDLLQILKSESTKERERHNNYPNQARFSQSEKVDLNMIDWESRAKTHLFKSKRLLAIAELLSIKKIFLDNKFTEKNTNGFKDALKNHHFKNAIGRLIRKAKAAKVGVNIMDITVCGSIAPYNHILGGKLICMLLTSPEISTFYKKKYGHAVSLIASSVKGKALNRMSDLVYLGTTSLYHIGASQYNRVKIPLNISKNSSKEIIRYNNLGYSEGFGSFHFSKDTLRVSTILLGRRKGGRKVNSIFGEGANPLMRKIKEAIELLGLESNPILKHNNKRVVYGIPLASNFKEFLIGYNSKPKFFWTQRNSKEISSKIAEYWIERWLLNRINNDKVLIDIEKHTLSYPIEHGGKVPLKEEKSEWSLF